MLLIFSIFSNILYIYHLLNNGIRTFLENLRISTFNIVSILSGTGYVTTDFSLWGKVSISISFFF